MATGWVEAFSQPHWAHLVIALLHTLWQGGLVAAGLYAFLRITPARHADRRYAATAAALLLVVLAGAATWGVLEYEPAPGTPSKAHSDAPVSAVAAPARGANLTQPANYVAAGPPGRAGAAQWTAWLVPVWLIGCLAMIVRAFVLVTGAGRLRRRSRPTDDPGIGAMLDELRGSLGIRQRVGVVLSDLVPSPAALGVIWPTVLLPATMVTGLPPDQLRLVLAHELAHIRRYDYLANMLQLVIEALLFFNPAVWWISRQMRVEREACCDAAAVAVTGQSVGYARTLADWAERLLKGELGAAAGLAGRSDGSLVDRVRRIVLPEHRPAMRARWYSVSLALLAGALVIAGVWRGTGEAARAAARLLSAQERIERLAKIEEDYADREYGEADYITVYGTVRTQDGAPLPDGARVGVIGRRPGYSWHSSLKLTDGAFSGPSDFGSVYLTATADGYAPTFAGPFEAEPGGEIRGVELVLSKGYTGRVRVVSTGGRPVSGAQVEARFAHGRHATSPVKASSDERGMVAFEHWLDATARISVTAEGYQDDTREVRLQADDFLTWELLPARPATGVVVSQETGLPVADARVCLLQRGGPWGGSYDPDDAQTLATTDAEGRFTLGTLRDGIVYDLFVEADGHRREFLLDVTAGEKDLKVSLGPELYVRGTVVGPLDSITDRRGRARITYSNPYDIRGSRASYHEYVTLDVRDGEGHFVIRNLWAGKLRVLGGPKVVELDLTEAVDDLVIDLGAEPEEPTIRTAVVRFEVPEGAPPPTGTLNGYLTASNPWRSKSLALPVENGEVRLDVPVPWRLQCDPGGLVGYWFRTLTVKSDDGAGGPLVVTIPVVPAGALYGRVLNADGSNATDASVTVVVVKKPRSVEDTFLQVSNVRIVPPGARFRAGPLPLGGTYCLVAQSGDSYAVSDRFVLDETQSDREVELRFVEGVTVPVTVLDPDGRPARGMQVGLHYSTPYKHGFGGGGRHYTDSSGQVRFEHVNPDVPGGYDIQLPIRRRYLPVRVDVKPDGRPIEIRLEKGLTLSGVVIDDATGYPVPEAEVLAFRTEARRGRTFRFCAETGTDAQGRFRFSNLEPGTYRILVAGLRQVGVQNGVLVEAGQNEEVTTRVIIPEWSNLKPRKP